MLPSIQELAVSQPSSPNAYSRTQSDSVSEDNEGNGQEEITILAKKILQYANGDLDSDIEGHGGESGMVGSVGARPIDAGGRGSGRGSRMHSAASSVSRRGASQLPGERDAELRKSVRDALGDSDDDA